MAIDIAALREEHERRSRLRKEGVGAARDLAAQSQAAVGRAETAFAEGGRQGTQAIRQQAARSLAAGLSGSPGTSGGAGLAAARQTALSAGGRLAEFQSGRAERHASNIAGLRQQAAMSQLEAARFEREAGSDTSEAQDALASLEPVVQGIISRHKGFFNDDEDSMAKEILSLAAQQTNPAVRAALEKRAADIKSKRIDV